jgi:acyl-coenzyme A thioesterase 9
MPRHPFFYSRFNRFSNIGFHSKCFGSIKRPPDVRIGWGQDVLSEVIPFSSKLIAAKGGPYEMIAVNYCRKRDITIEQLTSRPLADSWVEIILPFHDHEDLRDSLARADGKSVRYGNLFELLDALAADVSRRHCVGSPVIVTASVDGVRAFKDIDIKYDLKLQGYLSYVGKSSMEVNIDIITSYPNGEEILVGHTLFIMVARSRETEKAAEVPALAFDDENDQMRYELGKQRALYRRQRALESLTLTPPKPDEIGLIHKLYLESKKLSFDTTAVITYPDIITQNVNIDIKSNESNKNDESNKSPNPSTKTYRWMRDTCYRNALFMHAQDRNMHGKIFGGFLMKTAFELAYVSAVSYYGHNYPFFVAVDDIQFVKSVAVGSIMELHSTVVYNEDRQIVIKVVAHMVTHGGTGPPGGVNVTGGTRERVKTNTFVYVFDAPPEVTSVPNVVPREYKEFVLYLEGRRSLEKLTL